MIRSTTSFLSAAITSPPPSTEPCGPGRSSFGPRSPVSRLPRRAGGIPPFAIFGQQVDGACGSGPYLRAAEPFVETDAAEARLAQRHERALLDPAAPVSGLGVP